MTMAMSSSIRLLRRVQDVSSTGELEACLDIKRALGLTDVVIDSGRLRDVSPAPRSTGAAIARLHAWPCGSSSASADHLRLHRRQRLLRDLRRHDGARCERSRPGRSRVVQYRVGSRSRSRRRVHGWAGERRALVCRRTLGDRAQLVWHGQPNRTTPASYYGSDYNRAESRDAAALGRHAAARGAWIDADDPSDGQEQGAFYVDPSGFARSM
jgi:hypothetical protein